MNQNLFKSRHSVLLHRNHKRFQQYGISLLFNRLVRNAFQNQACGKLDWHVYRSKQLAHLLSRRENRLYSKHFEHKQTHSAPRNHAEYKQIFGISQRKFRLVFHSPRHRRKQPLRYDNARKSASFNHSGLNGFGQKRLHKKPAYIPALSGSARHFGADSH